MGHQRPGKKDPLSVSGMGAPRGPGKIGGIFVTPGTDATIVQVYDSEDVTLTNDMTLFGPAKFVANAKSEYFPFVPGLLVEKGIYVAITGTSVSVIVYTY